MLVQKQSDLDKIVALIDQNRNLNCLRLTVNQRTLVDADVISRFQLPGEDNFGKMTGENEDTITVRLYYLCILMFDLQCLTDHEYRPH